MTPQLRAPHNHSEHPADHRSLGSLDEDFELFGAENLPDALTRFSLSAQPRPEPAHYDS